MSMYRKLKAEPFMKNENILYIVRSDLQQIVDLSKEWLPLCEQELGRFPFAFAPRAVAETDSQKKQLIPYVLVKNAKGELLSYRRQGSEKRLAQKYSLGIGGHVNDGDLRATLLQTLLAGACREMKEEIGADVVPSQLKMIGLINEERTDVGHSHTGIVFVYAADATNLKYDDELGSPEWVLPEMFDFEKAELWSSLALNLYLGR